MGFKVLLYPDSAPVGPCCSVLRATVISPEGLGFNPLADQSLPVLVESYFRTWNRRISYLMTGKYDTEVYPVIDFSISMPLSRILQSYCISKGKRGSDSLHVVL